MSAARLARLCALLALLALPGAAHAVEPDEMLADPALEARARSISEGLRCLVCQNESVDESHAPLAHDIRVLVRKRLEAGDTNAQVRDYLVARYGQFILLRPPLELQTLLLWGTPLVVLLAGGAAAALAMRRRPGKSADAALSDSERRKLEEILQPRGPTAA